MLQLQEPDGGVFHKQTSDHFCAFILPQDDHLVSNVVGTGTAPFRRAATGDLAAVMAIAARAYAPYDKVLAARFLAAARSAWTWAARTATSFSTTLRASPRATRDNHVADQVLWASAELWRTTGEAQYEQQLLEGLPKDLGALKIDPPSGGTVASVACWTYAMAAQTGDVKTRQPSARRRTKPLSPSTGAAKATATATPRAL